MAMTDEQPFPAMAVQPAVKTICIVEDDESIGDILLQALSQETPYEAFRVPDAVQALEAVETRKPSLLLLDYLLPDMNGIALYERLNEIPELAHIPAILLTASSPPRDKVRKLGLSLLKKPFDLGELLLTIERLLQ
jgi:DNA-binding response OmpR family regulator